MEDQDKKKPIFGSSSGSLFGTKPGGSLFGKSTGTSSPFSSQTKNEGPKQPVFGNTSKDKPNTTSGGIFQKNDSKSSKSIFGTDKAAQSSGIQKSDGDSASDPKPTTTAFSGTSLWNKDKQDTSSNTSNRLFGSTQKKPETEGAASVSKIMFGDSSKQPEISQGSDSKTTFSTDRKTILGDQSQKKSIMFGGFGIKDQNKASEGKGIFDSSFKKSENSQPSGTKGMFPASSAKPDSTDKFKSSSPFKGNITPEKGKFLSV